MLRKWPKLMYLTFLILVGAFFWAVATGSVLGAATAYVCAGLAWRVHDHQKPFLDKPRGGIQSILLLSILLWPLRLPVAVEEYFWRLRNPNRFLVFFPDHSPHRAGVQFASWDQAIAFARKEAVESGKGVWVADTAKFTKSRGTREASYMMYWVSLSGDIVVPK